MKMADELEPTTKEEREEWKQWLDVKPDSQRPAQNRIRVLRLIADVERLEDALAEERGFIVDRTEHDRVQRKQPDEENTAPKGVFGNRRLS